MKREYIDFKYYDEETGEIFFVELKVSDFVSDKQMRREAYRIALENFNKPKFICTVSDDEADLLGYDTY